MRVNTLDDPGGISDLAIDPAGNLMYRRDGGAYLEERDTSFGVVRLPPDG